MSADSFSRFPYKSWVEYQYPMKPFFTQKLSIYTPGTISTLVGIIHKKEKHLLKRANTNTMWSWTLLCF